MRIHWQIAVVGDIMQRLSDAAGRINHFITPVSGNLTEVGKCLLKA